jgi:hypothetical protein
VRLPSPVAYYIGHTLQRLGAHLTSATPSGQSRHEVELVGLTRARAALSEAQQQMPGLLGAAPDPGTAGDHDGRAETEQMPVPVSSHAEPPRQWPSGDVRMVRVEEVISRLDEERRQLSAEVSALRLIAEELRDTLVRLDEGTHLRLPPVEKPEPAELLPAPSQPAPEPIFPAGSVGVELQISSIASAAALEELRQGLARQAEVDGVRVMSSSGDLASLRLYLRFPMERRGFIDLLARAAPAAKALAGPAPSTLLLRLRPS